MQMDEKRHEWLKVPEDADKTAASGAERERLLRESSVF